MQRLKEGSTWAGLATLLGLAAAFVPPQYTVVVQALAAGAAGVAVKLPEAKSEAK